MKASSGDNNIYKNVGENMQSTYDALDLLRGWGVYGKLMTSMHNIAVVVYICYKICDTSFSNFRGFKEVSNHNFSETLTLIFIMFIKL